MRSSREAEMLYGYGREEDRAEENALFDTIDFTHRERQLIRSLVEQFILEETERANLIFDEYIYEYELVIARAISILKKVSKSSKLHHAEIMRSAEAFEIDGNQENVISLDKDEEYGSGAKA